MKPFHNVWYLLRKKEVLLTRLVTKKTYSKIKVSFGLTHHEMYIITVNRKVIRKLSNLEV